MASPVIHRTMDILKLLRQVTEGHDEISAKLSKIVKIIAEETSSAAASVFFSVDDNYLELFATYGLNETGRHQITARYGKGLIGSIAQSKRVISIADAPKHPKFSYRAELGEDNYHGFLGVPLIRMNRAIGVLAVQKEEVYEYSEDEIQTLETVAMVLSEVFSSEEMNDYKKTLVKERGISGYERIKGISLNKGYGLGRAIVHHRRQAVNNIFAEDKEQELRRLATAHKQMNADLDEKFNATKLGIGEHVDILDVYRMFAKDKGWYKKIEENVNSGLTAETAVERAYEDMWNRLSATSDQYLKERLHDLRDVADRLQNYLSGDFSQQCELTVDKDIIVVAQTMGPADLMDYDYKKIRGLVIEDGTATMHVAIVAKALNIPVITKIKGLFNDIKTGDNLAIDGNEGYIYRNPSKEILEKFQAQIAQKEKLQAKLAELKKLPAISLDNQRIGLYINVGLSFDVDYIEATNCDGVGLYRTEIPFMSSDEMPNVSRQVSFYKELMDKAEDKKVIFRSLDVGSDKFLPYWSAMAEENPAIGWRSIRISLDRRAILRKQVRAFLRAAAGKELNVMFPMISDVSEFEEAKETLLIEFEKEKKRGTDIPSKVNVGLMIEVPSIVFQLEDVLKQADFISIGTNDLAQFTFACDRGNPRLTERYDVLSSPFLHLMGDIVSKANAAGVYCSVCGEMASNPLEALALIGLGYRNLSASGASFGRIKSMIRSINVEEVTDYIKSLLKSQKRTLRPQLKAYAYDHNIEIY